MRYQGLALGGAERRAVAEFITGRSIRGPVAGDASGRCNRLRSRRLRVLASNESRFVRARSTARPAGRRRTERIHRGGSSPIAIIRLHGTRSPLSVTRRRQRDGAEAL
jgi:hypothetical protein